MENWTAMILCTRSTSRSHEHHASWCSENMQKVCLFYSQNNKIVWLSNMADTRFVGFLFLIVLFECRLAVWHSWTHSKTNKWWLFLFLPTVLLITSHKQKGEACLWSTSHTPLLDQSKTLPTCSPSEGIGQVAAVLTLSLDLSAAGGTWLPQVLATQSVQAQSIGRTKRVG